ncbi:MULTISPECIES: hypothetical protein [unclassified Caballeronia]|uniref:hypothetical protein n=1 Tax=unclassified Caballeronia TaxID=2646786 RepID=UPI001F39CAC2|nr:MULTISPECIES: hypothetical protein [unclassified Caballeronia]MCE4541392.1 hypothetical protein [Caballeronia sp. PC1]MCE4569564.1 hypothetical protein [Caballeronia sp. CLC5]
MNQDIEFRISRAALESLHREAAEAGRTVGNMFRSKAFALAGAESPSFSLSGEETNRAFNCGVHPSVYARLVRVAQRMGVSVSCLGELVASFDMEQA